MAKIGAFRFWCQKVLPLVYDDSISYYELLNKMVVYLNNVISDFNTVAENFDNLDDAFDTLQGSFNDTKNAMLHAYDQLQSYVNNYFDNLDVQEEINNKLDEMAEDGSLTALLQPFIENQISTDVTAWLQAHITPTSPAVDSSLTVSGAAADAKVTGDWIDDLKEYNSYNVFEEINWPNHNYNGITATWDGEKYTVSGTATANSNLNLLANTAVLPGGITPGDIITFDIQATGSIPRIELYFYQNGAWGARRLVGENYQVWVPDNVTGMLLRFYVANGNTVDGTVTIKASKTVSNKQLETISPLVLPSDTIEKTYIINEYLTKYGIVQLSAGTFIINALSMPDNTILRGCGESTILLVVNNANGIIVGANCTIENLRITSAGGHTDSRGTGSGILVQGNYENTPYKYNTKISNVTIDGFACAGIHGKATGYWVANSISAVNCKIRNCWTGILLEDFCEFNRFTNCLCYDCYIGALLYSGNNVLVNCSLSNNTVGLYLIGSNATLSGNNGHGAIIGCTINHSNNNTGYAIIVKGITNGFLIQGCNIWYGKVITDVGGNGSSGILLTDCIFGGGTPEIINWGAEALILSMCIFKVAPTFRGNKTTIKINCRMFNGTAIE